METSWSRFHQGLSECYNKTGREIVQSVESCDSPSSCGQWVTSVANLWRTGGDVQNFWGSIMSNIGKNDIMADIAKPGHFNDPDMLQVGNVGLTPTEQKSHFSLWCIAGAPLLAGTDIEHATPATLEILTAPELLEINQDLGLKGKIQGKRIGPAITPGTPARTATAMDGVTVSQCTGKPSQTWQFVDPVTAKATSTPPLGTSVHVQSATSGGLMEVPGCAHAPVPPAFGPALDIVPNGTAPSGSCNGANTLFKFWANGSITSDVDGQCFNARHGGPVVQVFDCAKQAGETNGLWDVSPKGVITSREAHHPCVGVGAYNPPGPPPPPAAAGSELWVKPLSDGKRIAVLLLNLDDNNSTDLGFNAAMLNASFSAMAVRDAWAKSDLGTFKGNFTAKAVPPHGVAVYTVSSADARND